MIDIISDLLRAPDDLSNQMQQAKAFWEDFFSKHGGDSVADLAKALAVAQMRVERLFRDRARGKEMMPISALGTLYLADEGWQTNGKDFPRKLMQAFAQSMCSLEVKSSAESAVKMYWLDED